ncbi:MAG: nitroreductase family protein [Bacteroidota bacterium]
MNQVLALLLGRKSVRAFEPKPIGAEDRNAILRAAMRAPTAGNMMLYSIIELRGQAMYLRKFDAGFMREMNRSVRVMMAAWRGTGTED